MPNTVWLINRLKAMSLLEIFWRLSQKQIQKNEQKKFSAKPIPVTAKVFSKSLVNLAIDGKRLFINFDNQHFSVVDSISLLGDYDYELNKKNWHGGFQTTNQWPKNFSYSLDYKQRDDIGDARTNWELNRHFQFALLAKNYAASGERKYLDEFSELFRDWNKENPFLFGISWTSVMEVAIRLNNWCYAYGFLNNSCYDRANFEESKELLEKHLAELKIGIINMTDYVEQHYSRYSSANNHLIIEAFAIGQSGILFGHQPWIDLGVSLLTRELAIQNYADGVNKELSLHYQSFYMEAMGLMFRLLRKNHLAVPDSWVPMLKKMAGYLADCRGDFGEYVEFGDNDEGKVLDLAGGVWNHYDYVLGMMGLLLPLRYLQLDSSSDNENLHWLFDDDDFQALADKPLYIIRQAACYREGGVTLLRSRDKQVLIGIDHGELGFGRIAAHGHADALSFQMFIDGEPLFIDPGTYIYHMDIKSRNEFRQTKNHNTITIDGKDQSEMLGAFLWGKRAKCRLVEFREARNDFSLVAEHDGFAPAVHRRRFEYNGFEELKIIDDFQVDGAKEINFILNPGTSPSILEFSYDKDSSVLEIVSDKRVAMMEFKGDAELSISAAEIPVSFRYGSKGSAAKIIVKTKGRRIESRITL